MRPVIIQEVLYDKKDKVKTIVRQMKKILRERDVEAVKTIIYASNELLCSIVPYFEPR